MPRGRKNPWLIRRRYALDTAEDLVAHSQGFPIDLGRVAASRRVRRIHFKPLLVDGGIALSADGFEIYVRCEPEEADDFTARIGSDGTGKTLPRQSIHRARFTIAHEIAHTFFYDIKSSPPRLRFPLDSASSVRSLELACNRAAAALLLPERLLEHELAQAAFVTPRELRSLATRALVSGQTVIRRFERLRSMTHPEMVLAFVVRREGEWVIDAISRHYSFRTLFVCAANGVPLTALVRDSDFLPFGGTSEAIGVNFIGHNGQRRTIRFNCEGRSQVRSGSFFLVGACTMATNQ